MTPRLPRSARAGTLLALSLAALPLVPQVARAQYFGRNKVQYETFHFQVLRTDHFDVYYYPEEQQAAEQAARIAERWYARESQLFDHELSGRQPLILYASPAAFQQTNAIPGDLGEGTGGVTEALKRRIVLPLGELDRRDEPRHRPRAGARVPVRHHRPRARRQRSAARRDPDAAVVHRGHGGVRLARAARSAHRDVDAGRGPQRQAPQVAAARRPELLPVPLRAGAVGLHRRPVGRRRGGPAAPVREQGVGHRPGVPARDGDVGQRSSTPRGRRTCARPTSRSRRRPSRPPTTASG